LTLVGNLVVSSIPFGIEVVDSKSELVATDVLVPEEVSATRHVGSDVEPDAVTQWLSVGWLSRNGSDSPSLVGTIVAVPPDDMSVVGVDSTVDIQALVGSVSDVLSVASVELDWLGLLTSVGSDDSVSSDGET
jgi:hypothetical protein